MLGRALGSTLTLLLVFAVMTATDLAPALAQHSGGAQHQMPQQPAMGQHPGMPQHPATSQPGTAAPPAPGHGDHATPAGWKLAWPAGNRATGRDVFVKMECYSCHEVRGETFPAPTDRGKVGPELSMMGPLHEVDYFVEGVINPSATIEKGKGYEAPDGSSKMPSFNDSMSVQELVDLIAFLKSLTPGPGRASR